MPRLDLALVQLGLAPSRTKAQALIAAGDVEIFKQGEWRVADSASLVVEAPQLRLRPGAESLRYVSRGGLKLEAALDQLQLNVKGWRCLDVGLSTGGFSDCLLQRGAAHIVGVDVGHGQLSPTLHAEPRLRSFEGINARQLNQHAEVRSVAGHIDLCVVDVSFISLGQILPALAEVLPGGARLLALVKPQFEVGPAGLDKHGVVRDVALFADVEAQVLQALEKCGFTGLDYVACKVKGQDGNQEFFALALRR